MKLVGIGIVACLVLAATKSVITALLLVAGLAFVWGLFFRLPETLSVIVLCATSSWIQYHPFVALCVVMAPLAVRTLATPTQD